MHNDNDVGIAYPHGLNARSRSAFLRQVPRRASRLSYFELCIAFTSGSVSVVTGALHSLGQLCTSTSGPERLEA
jgi:hypothetical protein